MNETYPSCPKSVEVILGGDTVLSAGPITFDVTPCQKLGLKAVGNGGRGDQLVLTDHQRAEAISVQLGILFAR